jgi:hypothetical protein
MKSRLLLFAFTLAALWASAQSNSLKTHSIYGELLGPSNGLGIGYEYRFSNDKMWGLRTGFGWTYSESSFFDIGSSLRGYDIPIEINRLFGKKEIILKLAPEPALDCIICIRHFYPRKKELKERLFSVRYSQKKTDSAILYMAI